MLEGGTIGGLLRHRLDPGIDGGILGLWFFRPVRDQSPLNHDHFTAGFSIPYDRNRLRGRDVVAGFQVERRRVLDAKHLPQQGLRRV